MVKTLVVREPEEALRGGGGAVALRNKVEGCQEGRKRRYSMVMADAMGRQTKNWSIGVPGHPLISCDIQRPLFCGALVPRYGALIKVKVGAPGRRRPTQLNDPTFDLGLMAAHESRYLHRT